MLLFFTYYQRKKWESMVAEWNFLNSGIIQMCKIFHNVGVTLPHKIDFILGEKMELKEIRVKCIKPKMYLNNINLI